MSIGVECVICLHEIDGKRVPVGGEKLIIKSRYGDCILLCVGGHSYELAAQDLTDAATKCRR